MSVTEIQSRILAIQATFAAIRPATLVASAAVARAAGASAGAPTSSFAKVLDEVDGTAPATGDWASRLPEAGQRWAGAIEKAANDAGVDPRLVAAVAWTESGFNPDAVSGAGARGLMQLMPGTARGLGVDADNPTQNLAGGARYLAEQLDRFGSVDLALAAYNAGPAAVARHDGVPPYSETRGYVTRVLDRLRNL